MLDPARRPTPPTWTPEEPSVRGPADIQGPPSVPGREPAAFYHGLEGFSRFYPPEARSYDYSRHIMVAVDGSKESEHAAEWYGLVVMLAASLYTRVSRVRPHPLMTRGEHDPPGLG